jgi:dethiobiotin synthetase
MIVANHEYPRHFHAPYAFAPLNPRIVVTGTDTGIGKTVFAAGLTWLLRGVYWKPVQAGLADETDASVVRRLAQLPSSRCLEEAWRLTTPASPHWAAERDGISIDVDALTVPTIEQPLIIEGAGGLMVPLTRNALFIDVFARWNCPVVLCARTTLGTLNHTLLSLEALTVRQIPILGVAFIGDAHDSNQKTIAEMGKVRILGRLPHLDPLTPATLQAAFRAAFPAELFEL